MRELTVKDRDVFLEFNEKILDCLQNKEWFIPFSKEEYDQVLTPEHDFFYGIFDGDKLVAVSGLLLDKSFSKELCDVLGVDVETTAEVGGSMVLLEYRGQNLMYNINVKVVEKAREMGFKRLVATVHPDNVASRTSAEKLGFVKKAVIQRQGKYLRNVYLMDL